MIKHKRNFIFFALLGIFLTISSCSGAQSGLSVRDWMIFENNTWKELTVPATFRVPGASPHEFSVVRLQGKFYIENPSVYYGLCAGRIYHSDRVYINGQLIDWNSPEEIGSIHAIRNYRIHGGVLKKGENSIDIRLGVYGNEYGGLLNPVRILAKDEFKKADFLYRLLYEKIPAGIIYLLAAVLAFLILFMFFYPKEKIFFSAALLFAVYLVYLFILFSPFKLLDIGSIISIHWALSPMLKISLILLIQSLYRVWFNQQNKAVIVSLAVLFPVILFRENLISSFLFAPSLALVSEIIFIVYFLHMIQKLNRIKPDSFKFYTINSIVILSALLACFDTWLYISGSACSFLVPAYYTILLLPVLAFLGFRDFWKRLLELDRIYEKLKENPEKKSDVSITDTNEKKLERVLAFINENYTSDISREGLAAAVDINPNYLSSLFNAYTGKKINEYINGLRIEEAAKRLQDADIQVIEAALSVGFESLSTFNRVFKKTLGKSPREYRREI
ncbi:MAG: helix-turn-helix domain-containing protein [bacterium]|nr:helix-turn-helix domain-containing protein [bacterium]